ncbi:hypothetical protein NEDG_01832 [Nematocida displodere]|uniref:Uncharacterized protein n=1 Tax=Nematocida displodere TaxID=1805483 RepID=A0A177EHA1_9MICR|nr:hypothetical protein NEDG_01832 [Nematocida displodere]
MRTSKKKPWISPIYTCLALCLLVLASICNASHPTEMESTSIVESGETVQNTQIKTSFGSVEAKNDRPVSTDEKFLDRPQDDPEPDTVSEPDTALGNDVSEPETAFDVVSEDDTVLGDVLEDSTVPTPVPGTTSVNIFKRRDVSIVLFTMGMHLAIVLTILYFKKDNYEEYCSLINQLPPHIQESTLGTIATGLFQKILFGFYTLNSVYMVQMEKPQNLPFFFAKFFILPTVVLLLSSFFLISTLDTLAYSYLIQACILILYGLVSLTFSVIGCAATPNENEHSNYMLSFLTVLRKSIFPMAVALVSLQAIHLAVNVLMGEKVAHIFLQTGTFALFFSLYTGLNQNIQALLSIGQTDLVPNPKTTSKYAKRRMALILNVILLVLVLASAYTTTNYIKDLVLSTVTIITNFVVKRASVFGLVTEWLNNVSSKAENIAVVRDIIST